MVAEAVGVAWSGVQGWLTPATLFVLINLVVGTIAVASRLMPSGPGEGGDQQRSLLRAPSVALDRLRCFSFTRVDHAAAQQPQPPLDDPRPLAAEAEVDREHEQAHIERSRSEAAGEAPARRRRARRTRKLAREDEEEPAFAHLAPADGHGAERRRVEDPPAVEVDARADDFIRRFREQLRLQRLDSILRYRDTLRRAGTA